MKYMKYEMGPYNLHTIKTDRFKSVYVSFNFKRKAKKEELTLRSLLNDIWFYTSNKYKTRKELIIETEELYNLRYNSAVSLSGKYSIIKFDLTFLNEKYTEEGMLEKSLDFAFEMIFNPNVQNKKFDKNTLDILKENLKNYISQIREDPVRYATERCFEEVDSKSVISYHPDGYIEDIDKIDESMLYSYYESVLKSDLIDVFIIGDIDNSKVKNIFMNKFKIKTIKKNSDSHIVNHDKIRKRFKVVKEKSDNNQSNLIMGYKLDKLSLFERQYVMLIYCYILGLGPDSKLFRNVREKHSLCYSISCNFINGMNMLVIKTGINKKDYSKVLRLVKKEVKDMEKGNFKDQDISNAKIIYKSALKGSNDSPFQIVGSYLMKEYYDYDLVSDRMNNIDKVDRNMILAVSKKIHRDTVFLLEGDEAYE